MKKLLIAFALILGLVGISKAGGRDGQGWNVTIVTGTAATIANGKNIFLKKIVLSSGTLDSQGAFLQAYSSAPTTLTGAGAALFPTMLFISTKAITPPMVFLTTPTVLLSGSSLNNTWEAPNGSHIQIPPSGGLHIRKSDAASGGAFQAAVYWSE